jgi:hypothetical protein
MEAGISGRVESGAGYTDIPCMWVKMPQNDLNFALLFPIFRLLYIMPGFRLFPVMSCVVIDEMCCICKGRIFVRKRGFRPERARLLQSETTPSAILIMNMEG